MEAKLNVEVRTESGTGVARRLRRAGRVPGVVYGAGGANVLVSMEARETLLLLRAARQAAPAEDTIFELSLDDGRTERAKVREVQMHPYRPQLLHVDFMRVPPDAPGAD